MKLVTSIAPLPEAVRQLGDKTPVTTALRSADLERLPAALRVRSQISAGVESARYVSTVQEKMMLAVRMQRERVARGEALVDRSSFIGDLRKLAFAEGLTKGQGGLQDVASRTRLGLIYDMQLQGAQGYARRQMDLDPDVLDAYPAQELVRDEDRRAPRDWPARWQAAGGTLVNGRMVALKTDPIWQRISRFGTPWPPFDYSSGMGLEDISRSEAEALGLLAPAAPVPPAEPWQFDRGIEAMINPNDETAAAFLRRAFGDQIEIVGGRVRWTGKAAA